MRRMRTFRGTTCVVTGAASGIGRATAVALANEGARLVLTDLQADRLQEAVAAIEAAGGTVAYSEALDVTDHEAVRRFGEAAIARAGVPDVVMNIAGNATWGAVEALEHRHWQQMVDVNLMGPISVIEAFVPPMVRAGRGGHLVNVSSAAGLIGLPWHAAYSAGKFGLRGVSEVLRFDLRRHGIGVTLVCPGAVDTPLVQSVEIVGVDRDQPAARELADDFRRHAITPEQAAEAILDGVRRGRYLVFTSRDIRAAHLLQRWFPPAYDRIMLRLNDRLVRVGEKARATTGVHP